VYLASIQCNDNKDGKARTTCTCTIRARTARQTESDDVKNDTSCVVSCPTRPGTTDTKGAIEQMFRSITQEISRIFLRAIHGVHRQDERRPNPVFSSVAYQAYVRFDQIRTSNSLLHHVVPSSDPRELEKPKSSRGHLIGFAPRLMGFDRVQS